MNTMSVWQSYPSGSPALSFSMTTVVAVHHGVISENSSNIEPSVASIKDQMISLDPFSKASPMPGNA